MLRFNEFKKLQLENSLYKDTATRETLMTDKIKLMDSLMFNFFGVMGLFVLSDSRGALKSYETSEGALRLDDVGDANHDLSLSVKMAFDADLIPRATADKMVKLLALIKAKSVKSKNFDVEQLKTILDNIHYSTNKPSAQVYAIIKDFHDGNITLPEVSLKLYELSKKKLYKDITGEYRNLVLKGQYVPLFNKLGIRQSKKITPKSTPSVPTMPESFYEELYTAPTDSWFERIWTKYNALPDYFNETDFNNWYNSKTHIPITFVGFTYTTPFIKWLLLYKHETLCYELIIKSLDSYINGTSPSRKSITNNSDYATCFNGIKDPILKKKAQDNCFVVAKNLIEQIYKESNANDTVIFNYKRDLQSIKSFALLFDVKLENSDFEALILERQKDLPFIEALDFNLPTIIFFLIGLFEGKLNANKTTSDNINIGDWLQIIYGDNCLVDPNSGKLIIKKMAYDDSWNPEKQLFKLLISHKFLDAKIYSSKAKPSPAFIKHILSTNYDSFNAQTGIAFCDNFNDFDLKILKSTDIPEISSKVSSKYSSIIKFLKLISNGFFNSRGRLYVYTLIDIITDALHKNLIDKADYDDLIYVAIVDEKRLSDLFNFIETNSPQTIVRCVGFDYKGYGYKNSFMRFKSNVAAYFNQNDLKIDNLTDFMNWVSISHNYNKDKIYIPPSDPTYLGYIHKNIEKMDIDPIFVSQYIQTTIDDNKFIKSRIIKYWETTKNAILLLDLDKSDYPLNFANDSYFTKKMIDNFITMWDANPDKLTESRFEFSPKIAAAYKKWLEVNSQTNDNLKIASFNVMSIDDLSDVLESIETDVLLNYIDNTTNDKIKFMFFSRLLESKDKTNFVSNEAFKKVIAASMHYWNKLELQTDKDYLVTIINQGLMNLSDSNKLDTAEIIYNSLTPEVKIHASDAVKKILFYIKSQNSLFDDAVAIKPYEKFTKSQLINVLKYNNITIPDIETDISSFKSMERSVNNATTATIENLKVSQLNLDTEHLERKSVEFDAYNNYELSRFGLKFLKEFDVNLPIQQDGQIEFLKTHDSNKVDPAFHGTGSVAASMILRYGFKILEFKRGDDEDEEAVSMAGRNLGDGIYFSDVLDKAINYLGDGNMVELKSKGYLLQMSAELGAVDDDFVSDYHEWCVLNPNQQLRIYKAYEVEVIDRSEMRYLHRKYNLNENFMEIKTFKAFLRESVDKTKNASTYIFKDGYIPISANEKVHYKDVITTNPNIKIQPSQNGVMVIIEHNNPVSQAFIVAHTSEFMLHDTAQLHKFLNLFHNN